MNLPFTFSSSIVGVVLTCVHWASHSSLDKGPCLKAHTQGTILVLRTFPWASLRQDKDHKWLRKTFCFFLFFFSHIWVLRLFQEYYIFTYIEQIILRRWAKTKRKTKWSSISRTYLSHLWLERGSNSQQGET